MGKERVNDPVMQAVRKRFGDSGMTQQELGEKMGYAPRRPVRLSPSSSRVVIRRSACCGASPRQSAVRSNRCFSRHPKRIFPRF